MRTGATYIALVRGYAPGLVRLSGCLVAVSCLVQLRRHIVPGAEVGGHQLPRGSREKKEGMGWEAWTDLPTFIILFFFFFVYLHVVFDVNIP